MEFIDHTGHIFSLPHYSTYPQGYEYEENPYVFWFKDDYSSQLSVDCIYIQSIRPIVSVDNGVDISSIEIICESDKFKLLSSKTINDKINSGKDLFNIDLNYYTDEYVKRDSNIDNDFKTKLSINDITIIDNLESKTWYWSENGRSYIYSDIYNLPEADEMGNRYIYKIKNEDGSTTISKSLPNDGVEFQQFLLYTHITDYIMIPFYIVACNVSEAAVWMSNVLIKINTTDAQTYYCPITIGGTFVDEQEELIINGKNIGVNLPKDICRALYKAPFDTDYADLSLWNQKIKEYMLHHMKLKSERGNYSSALTALKWFGWNDKIEISALIQTDNEVINQYVLDKFDLNYDVINEFRYFRNSTLLDLFFRGVVEDKENVNKYNFNKFENDFIGEGKPNTIDLFDKVIEQKYDEKDIAFYRPYYDWTFNEIGLKLSALKYYYQKYFLPIHLKIHNISITTQTFANNIKFTNSAKTLITEHYVYVNDTIKVKFNEYNKYWLSESNRYIDIIDINEKFSKDNSNWIEFRDAYNNAKKYSDYHVFEIIDNSFSIPIKIISDKEYKYYSCNLYLYKDTELIKESKFSFVSDTLEYIFNFVIYPKLINANLDINFWLESNYTIKLLVNGNWYEYEFTLGVPELDIEMGKLKYKYDHEVCKQFTHFDGNVPVFNAHMYIPDLITVSNISFIDEYIAYMRNTYMYEVNEDNRIFKDNIYYYYYNEWGEKIILSSGKYCLRLNDGNYELVRRDILDLITNLSKEEIREKFPEYAKYLLYDGNLKDIQNPTFVKLLTEFGDLILDGYDIVAEYEGNTGIPNIEITDAEDSEDGHILTDEEDKIELESGANDLFIRIPKNAQLYSSIYKNIYSFVDLYSYSVNLPKNKKFLNRVHLFEIVQNNNGLFENIVYDSNIYSTKSGITELTIGVTDDGVLENLKFGDNDSYRVQQLYSEIFNENGEWVSTLYGIDDNGYNVTTFEQENFDFYLMHDNDVWYGIMISKETIEDKELDLNYKSYKIANYNIYLKYVRSDDKFLINRMEFVNMNGIYHFNNNDIIVAKLNNFSNIPFKLSYGSKWKIQPLGIGNESYDVIESNTNFAILSVKESNINNSKGYYSVSVSYSIDNFINNTQERKTRFLIS